MNIYLIEQSVNTGYDTFDSAVVIAASENDAKLVHPKVSWAIYSGSITSEQIWAESCCTWAGTPEDVTATLIGTASDTQVEGSVICASFNTG
jgi:hypothetical protein